MQRLSIIIADITRTGGTERATINLANMLEKNFSVEIISLQQPGNIFFQLNPGVRIRFLGMGGFPNVTVAKFTYFLRLYFKLKACFKVSNPTRIIGQGHNISILLPFFKNNVTQVFASEHIDFDSIPNLSKILMKIIYPLLDGVVTLSEIAKLKLKGLNKNVVIIPNSLPFVSQQSSNLDNNRIIMVGRISQEKGYERIIPIAVRLQEEFPEWRIDIFGTGNLKEDLLREIEIKGVKNVTVNDPVKNIIDEYFNSSVLAITSYNEAMPMVILEAQHCGLPVVGYYCEGTANLIQEGKTGYIAVSDDDFFRKLKELIVDYHLRKTIGTAAKHATLQYTPEYIVEKWKKLLI